MLRSLLIALTVLPIGIHAKDPPAVAERILLLAGGSLRICSDLAQRSCLSPPEPRDDARGAPLFRADDEAARTVADPALWAGEAAQAERLAAWVAEVGRRTRAQPLDADAMDSALRAVCLDGRQRGRRCRRGEDSPWLGLDDASRAAVLAALEVAPPRTARERAYPALSPPNQGLDVMRRFVAEAAALGNARPRIAVVTASALDPFDAVDFYLSLFHALGADAEWWPLDLALARHIEASADCSALEQSRRIHFRMPRRGELRPDLDALQQAACRQPDRLAALPSRVQGVFFAGGDQWRLRGAFHDSQGAPLPWLQRLRESHARGELVVGGTSAGAAVQAAAGMLSNGSPRAALAGPGHASPPPDPGCERAGTCPSGLRSDALTFWPAGGLGLANRAVVDTHFSERAREPRLLRLLEQTGAAIGYGVDEGSALLLRERGGRVSVEALGQHGGWVFLRPAQAAPGDLTAEAWYLATGTRLELALPSDQPARAASNWAQACLETPPGTPAADALQPGALRAASALLAHCGTRSLTLKAGEGTIVLGRTDDTRIHAAQPRPAIGPLQMHYQHP